MGPAELFSKGWCEGAKPVWDVVVVPNLVDPDNFSYIAEFRATDTDAVCQLKAEKGRIVEWDEGKRYSDEEATFLIDATKAVWQQIAEGKLDPVGAVASKRIHLRKGSMTVVIKEAKAFTGMLESFGKIATIW